MLMHHTMRWFGPADPVSLNDIRQAGCNGVVTALHHIPVGELWETGEILARKKLIEAAGMKWTVVESLPVSEEIKKQSDEYLKHIQNYKQSLINLAACGLKVITYNFMPVLDWVRTDVSYTMPDGSKALYFEKSAFIAFDLFLLRRPGAEKDYSREEIAHATGKYKSMSNDDKMLLLKNALLGLPGSNESFTSAQLLQAVKEYSPIDSKKLKQHLFFFLKQIIPTAEKTGIQMAIHPDDPPYSVLGLPRVVSTEQDLADIIQSVPSPVNGLCFCTGSLGARKDNNLIQMIQRFGDHIFFYICVIQRGMKKVIFMKQLI